MHHFVLCLRLKYRLDTSPELKLKDLYDSLFHVRFIEFEKLLNFLFISILLTFLTVLLKFVLQLLLFLFYFLFLIILFVFLLKLNSERIQFLEKKKNIRLISQCLFWQQSRPKVDCRHFKAMTILKLN